MHIIRVIIINVSNHHSIMNPICAVHKHDLLSTGRYKSHIGFFIRIKYIYNAMLIDLGFLCECVCERERVCVCERERESECVCVCERECVRV